VRIDTLTYNNIQTQGAQRRAWLRQHSPQHLQQCAALMLKVLQIRQPSVSHSTLVLGAGACTEVPLAELARDSDEVVLADLDLASMQQGRDELSSPTLRKRVRLLACDISGGVSAKLNRLIGQQPWGRLVPQDAQAVYDAAARCLEQCPVPDPPEIEGLHPHEFGVVISSLVLTQLFSYPLLDILDHVQRIAPGYLGEQERHRHYQKAAQAFRVRVIRAHLHLLQELLDVGGIVVLLSDVRGFVFDINSKGNDVEHRRTMPLVPRTLSDLIHDNFMVMEERNWEWITDLPEKGKLGRGYEVIGYILKQYSFT
jgi:predicted RNA methylase